MPAKQRGSVTKLPSGRWRVRYYDEHGTRQTAGTSFGSKTQARDWLEEKTSEVDAARRGEAIAPVVARPATVDELLDVFLDHHGRTVDPATERNLRAQLRQARKTFGDRHPDSLHRVEVEDWRGCLAPGSQHGVFRAFRQALAWAVERDLATRNASVGIKNPKRKRHERREVFPFETWDEVDAVAAELDRRHAAIPNVAVGTGLRPEELFGLHRTDVDRAAGVLHVQRRFTGGLLKDGGKTARSVRAVPLRRIVIEALDSMTPRLDTPVLFPAPRGGYIDIERFRYREWAPALRAAGLEHRRIYDMRHTFATWAIEGDVHLSHLATIMGTSVTEIEDTYARWLRRTDDRLRAAFDTYDAAARAGGS